MALYVGLDVSISSTAICMINDAGRVEGDFSARSHPDELATALGPFSDAIAAIGVEAGPMSTFLVEGLIQTCMPIDNLVTRRNERCIPLHGKIVSEISSNQIQFRFEP